MTTVSSTVGTQARQRKNDAFTLLALFIGGVTLAYCISFGTATERSFSKTAPTSTTVAEPMMWVDTTWGSNW